MRRRTNKPQKRMQRMIARQEARKEALRLARLSIEEEVAAAHDYIKELVPLIAPGDLFTCRGYYGDLLIYRIDGIYVDAPSVEGRVRVPMRQTKIMVNYLFCNIDKGEQYSRQFPLSKFLFLPVHGNTYRRRALRPL
ncbi:hypothetical protein vBVcaS_HC111 [Vibrio phage vB_VcaS_HC]|nr:hypothetical protein vBVcaS_HC111 [Vibrio phage vB_VcaS_HC]